LDDPTKLKPTLTFPDNFSGVLNFLLTASNGSCKHSDLISINKTCLSTTEKCTDPIQVNIDVTPPNCVEPASGSIQIASVEAGFAPYQFQLDDGEFSAQTIFPDLSEGIYQLTLKRCK